MASTATFADLRRLGTVLPNPASSLRSQGKVELADLDGSELEANQILDRFFKDRAQVSDRSASLLGIFLEHLPAAGKQNLRTDIATINAMGGGPCTKTNTMRDLATHLLEAVLKPR